MAESKKPRRTRKASTSKTTKAAQTRQDTPDVVAVTADSFARVDQKHVVFGAATEITSGGSKVLAAVITADSGEGPGTIFPPSGASTGPVGWDDITDKPTEFPPEAHTHNIQDADDYHKPFAYVFDTFQVSASPNEPGEYHFQQPGIGNNLAFAKEDANGAVTEAIKNLSIGSTIYLNGVAFTTKSDGGSFSGGGSVGSWFIGITEDLSAFDTSGGLTITLEAPIADGDILQWDNTDQKFKPVQLTDEVGIDRIQDASDFALQPAGGVPLNNFSIDNTPGPGEWHINNQIFYLPAVDSNGVDQRANLRALAGQTLTITDADGTDWVMTNVVILGDDLDGGWERILLDSAEVETIDAGINKTGGIELASAAFTVAELPLAEGDVLQWNGTDQKFKPAQLETGGGSWNDLTDKPTEFPPEAHSHTASEITDLPDAGITRIQDASDFAYNQTLTDASLTFEGPYDSSPRNEGEWATGTSSKPYFYTWTGDSRDDEIKALQDGDAITFTFDNAPELVTTVDGDIQGEGGSERWFFVSDPWPANVSSSTQVIVTAPRFSTIPPEDIPLADGDHLQWDATDQKFKPVQLEASGGGSSWLISGRRSGGLLG